MPHAEINVPGLILVGRFSSDPHWPVLGDPEAVSPASVWRVLKQAGLLSRWKGKPSRKGTGFEQPPQAHRHWHIDVSCINLLGTRLEYAYSKTLYGANSESQWEKSLRVCTTRYFDFYFQLVVPEGEVPVADIETTLESTRDQNEMVKNLIRYVNTGRLRPALETLRARLKSIPAERLVNVLGALLEIGDRARHSGSMIAGQVPEILYVNLAIFDRSE